MRTRQCHAISGESAKEGPSVVFFRRVDDAHARVTAHNSPLRVARLIHRNVSQNGADGRLLCRRQKRDNLPRFCWDYPYPRCESQGLSIRQQCTARRKAHDRRVRKKTGTEPLDSVPVVTSLSLRGSAPPRLRNRGRCPRFTPRRPRAVSHPSVLPCRTRTRSRDPDRDPPRSAAAAPAAAVVRPPGSARAGNTRTRCPPE